MRLHLVPVSASVTTSMAGPATTSTQSPQWLQWLPQQGYSWVTAISQLLTPRVPPMSTSTPSPLPPLITESPPTSPPAIVFVSPGMPPISTQAISYPVMTPQPQGMVLQAGMAQLPELRQSYDPPPQLQSPSAPPASQQGLNVDAVISGYVIYTILFILFHIPMFTRDFRVRDKEVMLISRFSGTLSIRRLCFPILYLKSISFIKIQRQCS